MKSQLWLVVLIALTQHANSADLGSAIHEYADYCYKHRPAALLQAEKNVESRAKAIKAAKKNKSGDRGTRKKRVEDAERRAANAQTQLERLSDPLAQYFAIVEPKQLEVGLVRRVSCQASVFDVQSSGEAIISLKWIEKYVTFRSTPGGTSYLATADRDQFRNYWFTSWSGEPLITGNWLWIRKTLFCDGTKLYQTVDGGSRTIRQVQIVDIPKDDLRFTLWRDARKWHDKSGKFSVEAVAGESKRGKLTLHKKDGGTVSVPLGRLSDGDREYLKERRDKLRKASKS